MAYFQILTIVIAVTFFALWRMNILLSIGSSFSWFGLLAYHLNDRPGDIAAGSSGDTIIIGVIVALALAIPLITLSRMGNRSTKWIGSVEGDDIKVRGEASISLGNMSTDQYKAYLRNRLRRKR